MGSDNDWGGSDSVTEVTSQGFLGRIGGSIAGVAIGFLLFLAAFPLLMWNEGRAINTARALAEGRSALVSVAATPLVAANDGRLIYTSGQLATTDTLVSPSLLAQPPLKLRRSVEVFQWKEEKQSKTENKLGGGTETRTTYTYKQAWEGSLTDSTKFHAADSHRNPSSMPLTNTTSVVKKASLGSFRLSPAVLSQLNDFEPVPSAALTALTSRDVRAPLTVQDGWAYSGDGASQPRIGDFRVAYSIVPLSEASVIARQSNGILEPYTSSNGHELLMAKAGIVSANSLFTAEEESNAALTWVVRVGGWIAMLIGLVLIARPLSVLASVIPFLGEVLGAGAFVVALPVSLCLSLVTIAIAWIAVRPLLSLPLLAVGVALVVVPVLRRRAAAKQA